MLGSTKRSIDDLLGPPDAGSGGAGPARTGGGSWLRELPLLLGLACSLALIVGAMLLNGPAAPPVTVAKPQSAAAGDYSAGDVVDAGDDEVVTEGGAAPAREGAGDATPRRKPKKARRSVAQPPGSSTASQPRRSAATGTSGGSRTPARSNPGTRRAPSGGGTAKPGKIVNVTGTSASIRNGPLGYSLSAPTHTPRVGTPWRMTLTATSNGRPLAGKVKVDILHNGAIVGHAASGKLSSGRYAHDFDWPAESVGHPLTVKATVIGGGVQQSFLFEVKVKAG
jgi:hypothetical protein